MLQPARALHVADVSPTVSLSGKDVNVLVPMADLLNHDAGAAYVGYSLALAHFLIGNFRRDNPALEQKSSVQPLTRHRCLKGARHSEPP